VGGAEGEAREDAMHAAVEFFSTAEAVEDVFITDQIQELLVQVLITLVKSHDLTEENSLITDRTFLVKAV
jgi:hypothetical protein